MEVMASMSAVGARLHHKRVGQGAGGRRERRCPGRLAAVLAIAAALAAGAMPAQARPDSRSMTCAAAAAMVAQRGAVVMSTGPNTYDRYVSSLASCSAAEQLRPEWVPTRDQPKCFVGYTCYVPSRDGFGLR